jgi:hypothetical protein
MHLKYDGGFMKLTKEEAEILLYAYTFDIYFDSQGGGYYDDYRCPACFAAIDASDSKSEGGDIVHLESCKIETLKTLKVKLENFVKEVEVSLNLENTLKEIFAKAGVPESENTWSVSRLTFKDNSYIAAKVKSSFGQLNPMWICAVGENTFFSVVGKEILPANIQEPSKDGTGNVLKSENMSFDQAVTAIKYFRGIQENIPEEFQGTFVIRFE